MYFNGILSEREDHADLLELNRLNQLLLVLQTLVTILQNKLSK
jgi:hypothetical protein